MSTIATFARCLRIGRRNNVGDTETPNYIYMWSRK